MTDPSTLAADDRAGASEDMRARAFLERQYRMLTDADLLGLYVSRPDGTVMACSDTFARLLGFAAPGDVPGASTATLYASPAEREDILARVRSQRGGVEPYRTRLRRRDGTFIDVLDSVVGVFDASGALTALSGFVIDLTAVKERERHLRPIFYGAADAVLLLDDTRAILDANPAAVALFGVPFEVLTQGTLDALVGDDREELQEAWREFLALGESKREHRVLSGRGGARIIECHYRARVEPGRHLCMARDITERRHLEERLAQSEKIESIGRLAGGISHDFNNLLTAILGYTELLLAQHAGADDRDRADLEEIQRAGQRAAALTQQLLAFSRKQVLMPKEVDLNQTVAGLQGMLARLIREDIVLTCEGAGEPVFVKIDPTQIEQVILNLVLNARDALPTGGWIKIAVSCVPRSQVEVPPDFQSTAGEYVRLRVSDNGVGIAPEARAHLFEPFFTTKALGKGTGLGLASVYGIVRQSNGFITVDSEPETGTTFTMYFPAVQAAVVDEARPVAATAPAGGHETILLVEDEDAVRVIVSAVLRRHGYRVLEAATPRAACDIFAREGRLVDLLVTDVVMPEMNGPALAQRLISDRAELRVLFISGYADMATPFDSDNPNLGFLSKPFQASALAARVREMLSRPGRPGLA